jgi:molybdopterin molybdotransferase
MQVRIGFDEARTLTMERLAPLPARVFALLDALDLALAQEVVARVNSPSATTSLRDGVALRVADTRGARHDAPILLPLVGRVVAGGGRARPLPPGEAVEITTGAVPPEGADAVLESEAVEVEGSTLRIRREVEFGRYLLPAGADVREGQTVALPGDLLSPGRLALLAASGLHEIRAVPRPRVAVLATGDEVVAPGVALQPGQLYASNLVLARAWLARFGFESEAALVRDEPEALGEALSRALRGADAVLTAGGAWGSSRDFTVRAAVALGGDLVFHRVRLGPGKAVALVMVSGKPVFCLPGGPPSFEAALHHVALPGLLRLAGRAPQPFPSERVRVGEAVRAEAGWVRALGCDITRGEAGLTVRPRGERSRLQPDPAVILTPEGGVEAGGEVEILDLGAVRWGV